MPLFNMRTNTEIILMKEAKSKSEDNSVPWHTFETLNKRWLHLPLKFHHIRL